MNVIDVSEDTYYSKLFHKVAVVLIVIGALNWGLIGAARVNFVERIFGKMIGRFVYILVGIAALSIAFNRDTYLPFLGESVFPCSVLSDQIPSGATRSVQIKAPVGSKIVYWASEPADGEDGRLPSYKKAYREYLNAGVATADNSGMATLKLREPQPYKVPFKGRLEQHIHFRICGPTGFVGRIKTIFLADGRIEGFRS
jgi:uncharacterized membrane protein YuzA (DUF378 family)